jgi:hypothetical protein
MPWRQTATKDVATCDKPLGSGKHALIRGCPNGETHLDKIGVRPAEYIGGHEPTQGSEPSQYLKEKKATAIPLVAASECGTAQTQRSSLCHGAIESLDDGKA